MPLTPAGTVIGTYQYMSPEQLEGGEADVRSDIFAFGAVLHEMLTGRRAFPGKTQASVVASILKEIPQPISSVVSTSPPALDRLVRRCLEKEPDDRWQSASDLADELRWVAEARPEAGEPSPSSGKPKRELLAWAIAAVLAVVALLLGILHFGATASPETTAIRFRVHAPENTILRGMGQEAGPVAVSPDGATLAFGTLERGGANRLWVRRLNSLEARPLPDTEGGQRPFWSPDGRSLAFFAAGNLRAVEIAGGRSLTICPADRARGGTWSRDGVILFAPEIDSPLHLVSASGGVSRPATALDASLGEASHRCPEFLPDGEHFLFLALAEGSAMGIDEEAENLVYVASLDGGVPRPVLRGVSNVSYGNGHVVFLRGDVLSMQAFDLERLELTGEPRVVARGVQYDALFERGVFSVSDDVLAYQSGSFRGETQLRWYDRSGRAIGSVGEPALQEMPVLAPDGGRVAFSATGNTGQDIWTHDLVRDVRSRLTFTPENDRNPVWSSDGSAIAFSTIEEGTYNIYVKASSGVGDARLLMDSEANLFPRSWSSDGKYLVYVEGSPGTSDIAAIELDGDSEPITLLKSAEFNEITPRLSPDGRWLAYASNETGRNEVYVERFLVNSIAEDIASRPIEVVVNWTAPDSTSP